MEIVVVARVRAIEGRQQEAEKAFREVIAPTHAEEGCLRYGLHQGVEDRQTFMMIERWASREALETHLHTRHVQKLFAALSTLVEGPAEIVVLEPRSEDLGPKAGIG